MIRVQAKGTANSQTGSSDIMGTRVSRRSDPAAKVPAMRLRGDVYTHVSTPPSAKPSSSSHTQDLRSNLRQPPGKFRTCYVKWAKERIGGSFDEKLRLSRKTSPHTPGGLSGSVGARLRFSRTVGFTTLHTVAR